MDVAAFLALALRCAPEVAPDTLLAVARHESGLAEWSLHDNTGNTSLTYASLEEAASAGSARIAAGHSVDFGLMQVNSLNFSWLGLDPRTALDPCRNVAAGGEVLKRAYVQAVAKVGETPEALRVALSFYNTGDPASGFTGGYVRGVEGAAPRYRVPPLTQLSAPPPPSNASARKPAASVTPASAGSPFGTTEDFNPFARAGDFDAFRRKAATAQ
jgi:type IV secretion system protein VirB1